jgi:hypothetical protein
LSVAGFSVAGFSAAGASLFSADTFSTRDFVAGAFSAEAWSGAGVSFGVAELTRREALFLTGADFSFSSEPDGEVLSRSTFSPCVCHDRGVVNAVYPPPSHPLGW